LLPGAYTKPKKNIVTTNNTTFRGGRVGANRLTYAVAGAVPWIGPAQELALARPVLVDPLAPLQVVFDVGLGDDVAVFPGTCRPVSA